MIRVKHVAYCPYDPRYYLVLDPAEIYPDDPGNGTPVMVYFDSTGAHYASATYGCAIGEGELMRSDCGTGALPPKVYEWLEELHEYVEQFLAEDSPAPVDLEQFREAVTCWHDAALPANDVEAKRKAEAKRLLSIIDNAGKVDDARMARALEWVRVRALAKPCSVEEREMLSAIEEAIAAYDPACGARTVRMVDGYNLREVRAAVAELIEADKEYDAAKDALVAAKREKGNWRVNPLGHSHPAVLRVRDATVRRAAALARARGVE